MDPRKRQTATATPAKPGGLPLTLGGRVRNAFAERRDPVIRDNRLRAHGRGGLPSPPPEARRRSAPASNSAGSTPVPNRDPKATNAAPSELSGDLTVGFALTPPSQAKRPYLTDAPSDLVLRRSDPRARRFSARTQLQSVPRSAISSSLSRRSSWRRNAAFVKLIGDDAVIGIALSDAFPDERR